MKLREGEGRRASGTWFTSRPHVFAMDEVEEEGGSRVSYNTVRSTLVLDNSVWMRRWF